MRNDNGVKAMALEAQRIVLEYARLAGDDELAEHVVFGELYFSTLTFVALKSDWSSGPRTTKT